MLQMSYPSHLAIINAIWYATRIAATSRRGKVLIFKPKALSFPTTEVSYINFIPWKTNQNLSFWAGQSLKLRRNTYLRGFKSSLAVNFYHTKICKVGSIKHANFNHLPIWQRLLANQLGGFEYNFRCLEQFFRKLSQKLRSAFFLKLRFLKILLLVTWLKCPMYYQSCGLESVFQEFISSIRIFQKILQPDDSTDMYKRNTTDRFMDCQKCVRLFIFEKRLFRTICIVLLRKMKMITS